MNAEVVRMCSMCAGAFRYNPHNYDDIPDTHGDVGEDCPVQYRE